MTEKSADFGDDTTKSADFGDDFAKSADFIVTTNRAVADLLAALEQTPAEHLEGALPEIRKRAQRARHVLETVETDWVKLVNGIKARTGASATDAGGAQGIHIHLHLHLNNNGAAILRTPK